MRNYYLLITLTAISFCVHGQNSKADTDEIVKYFEWTGKIEYLKEPEYNRTILANNERNRDTLFLQNFVSMYYDSLKFYEEFPYLPNDLIKYIYAIDLNGDNQLDIFYHGPSGGEPFITQIFLNKGAYYKTVFKGYQDIREMKFDLNRLVSFRLNNPGCCADPQTVEYYYDITYNNNEPIFSLSKTTGNLYPTEKTKNTFNPIQEFSINIDNSILRKECYFLDGVEHPVTGGEGNIIATYKKGAKGKAIGFKKDGQNEWIYVIMNSPNMIKSCEFSTFMEQPTNIYGWMKKSETDLK